MILKQIKCEIVLVSYLFLFFCYLYLLIEKTLIKQYYKKFYYIFNKLERKEDEKLWDT